MTLVPRKLALVVAAALLAACAAVALPSSAEAGPLHRCGALSGTLSNNYFFIRARNVSCPDARAFVREFATGDAECSDRHRRCRLDGYSCRYRPVAYEEGKWSCKRRGGKRIGFHTGA